MPKKLYLSKQATRRRLNRRWTLLGAVLAIALIAVVIIIFLRPGGTSSPSPQPAPQSGSSLEIPVEEAYQKYPDDAFFLDVREPEEWDSFHIPNTTHIPLNDLPNRLSELPQGILIVVVCNSGNRSKLGRDLLLQEGFTDVTSMAGGVTGWSNMNYPIEGLRP